jgi:hypothetical protein
MAKRRGVEIPDNGRDLILQLVKAAAGRRLSWGKPLKRFCLDGDEGALKDEIPLAELLGEFAQLDVFLPRAAKFDDYHRRLLVFLLARGHVGDLGRWLKKYLPGEQEGEDHYGLVMEAMRRTSKGIDYTHLTRYAIQELSSFRKDGQPNSVGRYLQNASVSSLHDVFSKTGIGSAHDRVLERNYGALMKIAPVQVAKALEAMFKVKKERSFVEDFVWFYLPVNPGPLLPIAKRVVANMTNEYHLSRYKSLLRRCEKISLRLAKREQKVAIKASKVRKHRA